MWVFGLQLYILHCILQALLSFVGSLEPVNPRHFRVLVSGLPRPWELPRENRHLPLVDAGIEGFTLVIAENMEVHKVFLLYS